MLAEREEISRGIAAGESARAIAARLGRSPATVAREINRHGGRRRYRAAEADGRAWRNAKRPQIYKREILAYRRARRSQRARV
jgi:IS30 family transposase